MFRWRGLKCALTGTSCCTRLPKRRGPKRMPTYEYSCSKCRKNFETFQSMRDEPFRTCPKELCRLPKWGRGKVKRLLGTGAGLIFKGSGFYSTDYRSSAYKEAAKKDSSSTGGEKSAGAKESGDKGSKSGTSAATPSKPQKKPAE